MSGNLDAAGLHRAGIAAVRQGQLGKGLPMLEKAAALRPNSIQFLMDLGQVRIMAGRGIQAIETFQKCVKLDPKLVPAWLNLAILMLHADRVDEAGDCFQKAVSGNPKLVDAQMGLGVVRQRQKRLPEAAEAFEKAAQLAPDNPEILSNLAGVLAETGETERAITFFQKAVKLAPNQAALHTNLGGLLHELHGAEAGLAHYDAALKLVPGDARTLANKGSALIGLDRREEAGQIFDHDALIATKQFTEAPGYSDMASFNKALADEATGHETFVMEPLGRSTRGGGQTGQLFGTGKGPMAVLEQMIRGAVDGYFADGARAAHPYCPKRTGPGRIDAWATVLDTGGYQASHNHPSGILSGVYYVQLPDTAEGGAIEFGRPPPPFEAPSEPDVRVIDPEPGMLVMFPSFFWHRTIPFPGGGRRISIAFDLIMG